MSKLFLLRCHWDDGKKVKSNRTFRLKEDEAVSAVVSIIVMLTTTVAISATVYVYVNGMMVDISKKTPDVHFIYDNTAKTLIVASTNPSIVEWDDFEILGTGTYVFSGLGSKVIAGDRITDCSGEISIRYRPTNTIIGSWFFYRSSEEGDSANAYYKEIGFSGVVGGSHLNFPVLINIENDSDIADKAETGGHIYFTNNAGILLPHELISYSSGNVSAWVGLDSLSSTTVIRIYYGSTRPSANNPVGVWTGYQAVYHLEETGSTRSDSSPFRRNGTTAGGVTKTTSIPSLKAADNFNSGEIALPSNFANGVAQMTVEAWINPDSWNDQRIVAKAMTILPSNNNYIWSLDNPQSGRLRFRLSTGTSSKQNTETYIDDVLTLNQWYHVAATYDGSTVRLYVNGVEVTSNSEPSGSVWTQTSDVPLMIANNKIFIFNRYFDGQIDEVRITQTALPAPYIQTQFANVNDPNGFITLGSELKD